MSTESADSPVADTNDQVSEDVPVRKGYVYVATNPAMPDLVKIGSTTQDDPQSRISSLFNTSVPAPFEMVYAASVSSDPVAVEQVLHTAFAPQRVHPKREFFEIEPEQPIAILKLIDALDITEDVRAETDAEESSVDKQARQRLKRPRLDFVEFGLAPRTLLLYRHDTDVQVEIVNRKQVRLHRIPDDRYGDLRASDDLWYLSPLTSALQGLDYYVRPTWHWLTEDGRLLKDIFDEVHGPAV